MEPDPPLPVVLARFDSALAKRPLLERGAPQSALDRAEEELRTELPASIRALYTWRDGEAEGSTLFQTLCTDRYDGILRRSLHAELVIRFMSLDEVKRAGAFDATFDETTGECVRGAARDGGLRTRLVPFLWIHERGKDSEAPAEDDWLVAIDTIHEAAWLFQVGSDGIEDVIEEAPSLASWLSQIADGLGREDARDEAREDVPPAKASPRGRARATAAGPASAASATSAAGATPRAKAKPSSELLLQFLLDRKLLELREGVAVADVAARIAPLLSLRPEKRAVKEVVARLEDDDAVDELYADDDILRAIVVEFLD